MATPLTYSKTPGFATTAGQEFEINLCALVFLRARNSGLEFQLGSNVKGAGALDDLVFRCKTPQASSHWQTMYVQLKHREKSTVKRKMLTSSEGDFSLLKYFQSYLDIKQAMSTKNETLFDGSFEDSQYVIFTNANGNKDWVEWHSGNLSFIEKLVWFGSGSVFSFKTDEEIVKLLGEFGEEGASFLSRLRLFCGQPNANELKLAVKEELLKLDAETIRSVNIDRLCDCYLANVKVWCESKYKGITKGNTSSDILDNDHGILLTAVDKVRLESCSEQTLKEYGLDLEFEKASLPLPVAGLSVVQCSAGSCRVSLTKLVQASQGRCLVLPFQQLVPNNRALLAKWRKGDVKRLIVCTQDWRPELADPCFEVVKQMLDIRDTCSVRDIVFLQDGNGSMGSELTRVFQERCQSSSDVFEILQLTDGSRDKLFYKTVNLQGYETKFLELFNNDCTCASQVLDASLVATIMESAGPLTVGSALTEGIGYFVERTLEWACVKASIFYDLQGTVTIWVTQREASTRDLLEKALDFVYLLGDSPSFSQENKEEVVNSLGQSTLVPDENDGVVYVGQKFALGFYECNCVGLRFGQEDKVTALQVCPSEDASEKASFLFLSNQTNEDDRRILSEFHESKHLMSLKNGQLRWIQSHGDIGFARSHFDEVQVLEVKPETATDVEDRLVLVCAEPGMGKSTLMARLAKNTKAALPHYFVILLALNDHTKLLAEGGHEDVLGFLSSASKMDSLLTQTLLKHALEVSGNVVIIADGFDEIAPKYVNESCQLLSSLLGKTKASKIWITSRNSIKQTLEARLSKFSAKLRKFDEKAQRDFLKMFWAGKSRLSEEELCEFIDQLLFKTSQGVRDNEKEFMGIPLQMLMLAEVYEDHVNGSGDKSEIPANFDLLRLLEMFVKKKFRVYVEVKLLLQPHSATYEMSYEMYEKTVMASHSAAALSLILHDDELKTLGLRWVIGESAEFCKTISSGKDKSGFIVDVVNGKPRFLHRVFAEYFVAKWISERFADNTKLIRSKLFTEDFGVVRTIVDRILSLNFPLHTAVLNEDLEQVRTLLEGQVELVEAEDDGSRTALHLAAGLGTSNNREENVRRGEILDLLIAKTSDFHLVDDVLSGSPLRYADITQSWVAIDKLLRKSANIEQLLLTSANVAHEGMLETIFDLDLDRLLEFCLDHGLAVEHRSVGKERLLLKACKKGSLNVASSLIERNANINQNNGPDGHQSPFQFATVGQHLAIVKLLWEKFENSPSFDAIEYLHAKDKDGRTILGLASANHEIYFFLFSKVLDAETRKLGGNSALYSAALRNDHCAVQNLLEGIDKAHRAEVLNWCNADGYSVLNFVVWLGSVECVKLVVQAGAKLSQVGRDGETSLVTAAREGKQEVVEWLLQNFDADSECMSRLEFINKTVKDGNTAIHYAVQKGSVECVDLLVQAGAKLSQVGCDGETLLMKAAKEGKQEVLGYPLHNYSAESKCLPHMEFINKRDNYGNTPIHYATQKGSVECVELLVQAGAKLSQVGRDGETLLIAAARQGKQEVVEWLLHNFNVERERMDQTDYMNKKDKDDNTAIYYAILVGSMECVELLVQAGAKLSQVGRDGETMLVTAVKRGKQKVVESLLRNFNAECESLSYAEFIYMEDNDGNTAMHYTIHKGYLECVELLVKAGAKLSQAGRDGETPLVKAAKSGKQEIVKWMLHNFTVERDGMSQLEFINTKDKDGNTAMHYVALRGSVECVELLVQAGAKLSQVGCDGETLLMAAARQGKQEVVKWLLHNFKTEIEGMSQLEFVNTQDKYGNTAMQKAARFGHSDVITFLISKGCDVQCRNNHNSTPLHLAAELQHHQAVSVLLAAVDKAHRAEFVNSRDNDGDSVLICGALGGSVECVELLVQAGAKLSQAGRDGETSLIAAARRGKQDVVECLLHNFNAEREKMRRLEFINMKNTNGNSAMYYAALRGSVECVELLVQAGAKLSQVGGDGETMLATTTQEGKDDNKGMQHATPGGSVECVKLLVQAGAKLSQAHLDGETSLMVAARQGKQEVVEWLLYNFNPESECMPKMDFINMKDNYGNTAIYYAAGEGSVECIELLVKAGAKLTQVNSSGETPLMAAARKRRLEIVECLFQNFNAEVEGMTQLEYFQMKNKDGKSAYNIAGP